MEGIISMIVGGGSGAVEKKAKDPNMDLHENPMFDERPCPIMKRNMRRMHEDLKNRMNPANGHIYEAFKSLRYTPRSGSDNN